MTKYLSKISLFCSLLFLFAFSIPSWAETAPASSADQTWHYVNAQGELKIKLYFFWSKTCPHCAEAHPFIDSLPQKYPWIELESHMVSAPGVQDIWQTIAAKTTTEARSVPYMASCEKAVVGYSSEAVTGEFLVNRLKNCYLSLGGQLSEADLPTKGVVSTSAIQKPMRRYLAPAAQILAKAPAMPPAWVTLQKHHQCNLKCSPLSYL